MSLLSDVLPAATGEELLRKLRKAAGLRAVGVRRDPGPGFRFVDSDGVRTVDAVPPDATTFEAGFVAGECDAAVVAPLLKQAATMDSAFERAKLAAMAELAAGAGHEVNNPLATIAARADSLRRGEADPDRRRSLDAILAQAYRARDMIGDLMLFARPPEPQPEPVDWPAAAREVCEDSVLNRPTELGGATTAIVRVDPTQLRVLTAELIRNAVAASASRVSVRFDTEDASVRMTVTDDGPGVSGKIRRQIFDPFFSGREAGRGLGFGLSKCWRIAVMNGGTLRLSDGADEGATFEARLPSDSPTSGR